MTTTCNPLRIALFPGSFNPFTIGHKSIVDRALTLFDGVVVVIGHNIDKSHSADIEKRVEAIRSVYADEPRVSVEAYGGLTVDACREFGAQCIIRGVRSVADFEKERTLAEVNRSIAGVETLLMPADPALAVVSSSMVRELEAFGADTSKYLP